MTTTPVPVPRVLVALRPGREYIVALYDASDRWTPEALAALAGSLIEVRTKAGRKMVVRVHRAWLSPYRLVVTAVTREA